jgi:hypothetical protein
MAEIRLWHLGAILGLAMALVMTASHSEEDFAFEMPTTEEQDAFSGLHTHPMSTPVQKLWGIPDTMANVGKLFHMKIPGDAFSGEVDHYEVSSMISKLGYGKWELVQVFWDVPLGWLRRTVEGSRRPRKF